MNTTTNYQLNQWEADDRILRENFNSDNGKIDAALAEMKTLLTNAIAAMPYQKLLSVTTTAAAQQVDLDVSGIDFTAYQHIDLYLSCGVNNFVRLRVNGIAENYSFVQMNGSGGGSTIHYDTYMGIAGRNGMLHFFQPISGRAVGCLATHCSNADYGGLQYLSTVLWEDLTTINLCGNETIPIGSKISIYGVK